MPAVPSVEGQGRDESTVIRSSETWETFCGRMMTGWMMANLAGIDEGMRKTKRRILFLPSQEGEEEGRRTEEKEMK